MAVDSSLIYRIMGEPNSPTGRLVALRKTPGDGDLETGVWYSNFTRVKNEAERRGLPFFSMWTNGDLCGFCRRFTLNILEPAFLEKMRTSGGLWWLGGSMDDSEDDGRDGIGFKWCMGPEKKVSYFPFFSVSHVDAGNKLLGFFGSGHDYDEGKTAPDGTAATINKIRAVLSEQYPAGEKVSFLDPTIYGQYDSRLRIRINPTWDSAHVARFHSALSANGGHCPCRPVKTAGSLCLCHEFMDQLTPGFCRCGAFEKYKV